MTQNINFILLLVFFLFVSCENVPDFEPDESIPVVEAFLYTGNTVEDIKVTEIVPLGGDTNDIEIDGLNIEILWNGNSYPLQNNTSKAGTYFYPESDLEIISGETYEIRFNYADKAVSSTTTIPAAPTGTALSRDTITLPQLNSLFDAAPLQNANLAIDIAWENPDRDYFFLVIENIEADPEAIDVGNIVNLGFEFVSTPTQNNFFTIFPFAHYSQFGTHRIIIYRVNEEYALLYETIDQDSRDLNEPFTNINNGVGIFSGFASDTLYLEVEKL